MAFFFASQTACGPGVASMDRGSAYVNPGLSAIFRCRWPGPVGLASPLLSVMLMTSTA
jgi:hypothetical protein